MSADPADADGDDTVGTNVDAGVGDANPTRKLTCYVSAGCSATVALDLFMVKDAGMSPAAWAAVRGRTARAVAKNIEEAGEVFTNLDPEEVLE